MERLTINEVIEHCNRQTERMENNFGRSQLEEKPMMGNLNIMKHYWEHRQVAKWLKELKEYRDLEEQGRLIKLPISVENVIDKLFSHNEIVALWCKVEKDVTYHKLVWRGMAWDIPKKFKSCGFVKFFGTIPQNISQADTINIEVLLTEEAEKALAEMGE